MFHQYITTAEVSYLQERVRTDFIASQRVVSIRGLREIIGNTLIQMGSNVHGKAKDACQDAAQTRDRIRETQREWRRSRANMPTPIVY